MLLGTPGQYESYWHFHHKGTRFGHWLGCHIIVESPIPNYQTSSPIPIDEGIKPDFPNPFEDHFAVVLAQPESPKPLNTDEVTENMQNLSLDGAEDDNNLSKQETVAAEDTNCSSDSDNQSINSIADTNSSICSGSCYDFVVVTPPAAVEKEEQVPNEVKEENKILTDEAGAIVNDDNNNNNTSTQEDLTKNLADVIKKEGSKSG